MTEAAAAAAALYVNDIDRKKRQDRECNIILRPREVI